MLAGLVPAPAEAAVGRWTSHGPPGGPVNAIAVSPSAPNTVWAGTVDIQSGEPKPGHLSKSTDGGRTWRSVSALSFTPIDTIAADPADPDVVLVGTPSIQGEGVLRTADGGATWDATNLSGWVTVVRFDPTDHTVAYAGTLLDGLYKSVDGGVTWSSSSQHLGDPSIQSIAVDPLHPATVYAGTDRHGVFKSTNGGATWIRVNTGLGDGTEHVGALAPDPFTDGTVYAGTEDGVFKTTDGGGHWAAEPSGIGGGFVRAIAPSLQHPNQFSAAVAGKGVFVTDDGGATWTPMNDGLTDQRVNDLAVDPTDDLRLLAGTHAGPFVSRDGGASWRLHERGMADSDIETLGASPSDPGRLYAGGQFQDGAFRTGDGGVTWRRASTGLEDVQVDTLAVDPTDPNIAYAATGQGVFRTTDGGRSWAVLPNGPDHAGVIAVAPSDPLVLYASGGTFGGGQGVDRSTDGGATWQWVTDGLPSPYPVGFAIDPRDPMVVYAVLTFYGVFKTTDGGGHWVGDNQGIDSPDGRYIAVDPNRPDVLYTSTTDFMYRSRNGAVSWQKLDLSGCAAYPFPWGLAVDPAHAGTVYTTLFSTACRSTDFGKTWTPLPPITPDVGVLWAIAVSADGSTLHAGTREGGVFSYTFP